VHEQVLQAVRASQADVRWADVTVRHVGYTDPALRRRKLERDLRLLRLEDAERPDHPFVLFNLGSVSQELGQLAEALDYFRHRLALCCLRRGAPDEAEAHWRAALAERPDFAEARLGLEEVARRRGTSPITAGPEAG